MFARAGSNFQRFSDSAAATVNSSAPLTNTRVHRRGVRLDRIRAPRQA
jgi:hypothetical protein